MSRVAALFALVLLSACSDGHQESQLYGAYVATYENGTETLTLEKGGRFIQEVRLHGSDLPVVNTGTWQFTSGGVELEHCWGVRDLFGYRIRADFATAYFVCGPLPVARRWFFAGDLRLGGDEDPSPLWKVR